MTRLKHVTDPDVLSQLGEAPPIPDPMAGPDLAPQNVGEDFMRSYMQGSLLNYSDEALAGIKSSLGLGSYDDLLDIERHRLERIPNKLRIPAEMLGGAATTAAAAPYAAATKMGQAASQLPSVARLGLLGGVEGGIAGFGAGEGGAGPRLKQGALGATLGAGIGAAIPVATGAARAGLRRGASAFGVGKPAPTQQALRKFGEAIASDEMTLPQVGQRLKRLPQGATLADAGKENVRGLMRAAADSPGPAKMRIERYLTQRARKQADRLVGLTNRTMSGADYGDTLEAVIRNRRNTAAPLYEQAFAETPVIEGAKINALLKDPIVKSALKEARKVGRTDPDTGLWSNLSDLPDNAIEVLDQVYKIIGDKAQKARSAINRQGNKAYNLDSLRVALKKAIVERAPKYGQALDAFSEDSRLKDALELGRTALTPKSDATPEMIRNLPQAEKNMFLIGAGQAIEDIVETTGDRLSIRNATEKIFGNSRVRSRLQAAFPKTKDFRRFKMGLLGEEAFVETRRAVAPSGNSQTAPRLLASQDLEGIGLEGVIQDVRTANVFGPQAAARSRAARILESVGNRMKAGPKGVRAEIARLGLTPKEQGGGTGLDEVAEGVLRDIKRQAMVEELYRLMQAGLTGGGSIMGAREAKPTIEGLMR